MAYKKFLIEDLSYGSLVKVVFLCGAGTWVLFGSLMLLISFFAPEAITINGAPATGPADGVKGFLLAVVMGSLLSLLFAAIGAGIVKFLSKFVSFGSLDYFEDRSND